MENIVTVMLKDVIVIGHKDKRYYENGVMVTELGWEDVAGVSFEDTSLRYIAIVLGYPTPTRKGRLTAFKPSLAYLE